MIILVVLIALTTYFSFKYSMSKTTTPSGEGQSQMKTMLIVMTVFITFASFSLPTAIALYWIVTYAFIVIQTFVMNLIDKKKEESDHHKTIDKKSINSKLKIKEGMKYGKNK